MANAVMAKLTTTVFLRPILFISIPVGMDRMRNQRKQDKEISPDTLSSMPAKSALHIAGRHAHDVHESHNEKAEHYGQDCKFGI